MAHAKPIADATGASVEKHAYAPSCPCVDCERYRAMNGMSMLNPRAAVEGNVESRPGVGGVGEIR